MPTELQWTKRAAQVMANSISEAEQRRSNTINVEHLLIALIGEKEGAAADVLRQVLPFEPQAAVTAIDRVCAPYSRPETIVMKPELSPSVQTVLNLAHDEARNAGHGQIGVEHMLLGLVSIRDGVMQKILAELKLSPQMVRLTLHEQFPEISLQANQSALLKERLQTEFYHNFAYYIPQPIRKLFGRFLDSSKMPPLG